MCPPDGRTAVQLPPTKKSGRRVHGGHAGSQVLVRFGIGHGGRLVELVQARAV